MVHFLSALDRLLSAAPTLLSEGTATHPRTFVGRPRYLPSILHALYDEVLREPVPQRLVEMVRRERTRKG
jgi:hypothetical protein